jgi:hypothetical protein
MGERHDLRYFQPPAPSIPDSPGHIREFLDGIKSRQRTSERLYWDDEHERFTGKTDANRYVTRFEGRRGTPGASPEWRNLLISFLDSRCVLF